MDQNQKYTPFGATNGAGFNTIPELVEHLQKRAHLAMLLNRYANNRVYIDGTLANLYKECDSTTLLAPQASQNKSQTSLNKPFSSRQLIEGFGTRLSQFDSIPPEQINEYARLYHNFACMDDHQSCHNLRQVLTCRLETLIRKKHLGERQAHYTRQCVNGECQKAILNLQKHNPTILR